MRDLETRTQAVTRHKLKNGMVVLLKEQHSAPVISWWVLYRVGSRDEPTGLTGASHWVEHMLFKGTEQFPAGYLDKEIDRNGGSWNAQTWLDYTAYHETLPADKIDLALRAEADRMINAAFRPAEVDTERTVIISERQGSENSPGFWLTEATVATAFRVHSYHHMVIGDKADLQSMTRDDLYNHYKRYYMPNNAIAAIVGDFDTAEMIERIEALYGDIPVGDLPRRFNREEPAQTGERRLRIERPGGAERIISIGHKVPGVQHPDWIKLYLLDSILGGAGGFGGGGVGNRTSRLYQNLVKRELTASISSGLSETIDPYLYSIDATVRRERSIEEVEAAIIAELDKVRNGDIQQSELDKALKQSRALLAYSGETVTNQAYLLTFLENATGDATWLESLGARLNAITLDQLVEVANTYLIPAVRTVGWYMPTGDAG